MPIDQLTDAQLTTKLSQFNRDMEILQAHKNDIAAKLTQEKARVNTWEYVALKNGIDKKIATLTQELAETDKNIVDLTKVIAAYQEEINYRRSGSNYMQTFARLVQLPHQQLLANKTEIYLNADRALLSLRNTQMSINDQIQCWRMVRQAQKVLAIELITTAQIDAAAMNEQMDLYLLGAKKIFTRLMYDPRLQREMQLLKILYVLGEYDQINEIFAFYQACANDEEYTRVIGLLNRQVDFLTAQRAEKDIDKRIEINLSSNASALLDDVKEELIKQRAFVIRMHAFLEFSNVGPNDPLRKEYWRLSKKIEANISSAILNARNVADVERDVQIILNSIALLQDKFTERYFSEQHGDAPYTFPGADVFKKIIGNTSTFSKNANIIQMVHNQGLTKTAEAMVLPKGIEIAESQKLSAEIDPVDFIYLMEVDKAWQQHTAKPIDKIQIKKQTWGELVYDATSMDYYSSRVINIVTSLFSIVIAILMTNLIILTALFPILWPAWLVLVVTGLVVLAVWQIAAPGTRATDKTLRLSALTSFNIGMIFNFLFAPMRALRANYKQAHILRSALDLLVSVVSGVAALILVPVVAPVITFAGLFGFAAGLIQGKSFKEIANILYVKPFNTINALNIINAKTKQPKFVLSEDQSRHLNQLDPNLSQKIVDLFRGAITNLEQKIAKMSITTAPEEIQHMARAVSALEKKWRETENLIKDILQAPDETKQRKIEVLCAKLDAYLLERYEQEREQFIQRAKARKARRDQINAATIYDPDNPPNFNAVRFSKKQTTKLADNIRDKEFFGQQPNVDMQYEVDYVAERADLEQLLEINSCLARVRAKIKTTQ